METTLTQTAGPVSASPEKPKRRRFAAEYKLRILEEADRCTKPGEIGLLLRREGIYASHLTSWRAWRRREHPEHPQSQKPATESQMKQDLRRLQRENDRLRLKLDHTEKLVALQKKFADLLEARGIAENDGSSA
jgi:transposase-like protein